jgi:hypothetical protein
MDGVVLGNAGMGTPRADTAGVCGRSDTGFSYLYNYALLKGGTHRVDAYADGLLFASATFSVGYLGGEYLTGLSASHFIADFPSKGSVRTSSGRSRSRTTSSRRPSRCSRRRSSAPTRCATCRCSSRAASR